MPDEYIKVTNVVKASADEKLLKIHLRRFRKTEECRFFRGALIILLVCDALFYVKVSFCLVVLRPI